MSVHRRAGVMMGVMGLVWACMLVTVARASNGLPDADTLAVASTSQLLATMVCVEAGVIVALAGGIAQAYRGRVKALERQVEACRKCAADIASAMRGARQP